VTEILTAVQPEPEPEPDGLGDASLRAFGRWPAGLMSVDIQHRELIYQLAAEAARIGTWDRDMQSDVVAICPVMAEILDMPKQYHQLSAEKWRSFYDDADLTKVEQAMQASIATGVSFCLEIRVRTFNGKIIWLQTRGMVFHDAQGAPSRITGISIDISSMKAATDAAIAEGERFRLLADLCPDGILVLADGRYMYANQEAARMFGVASPAQLIGRPPEEFIDADSIEEVNASLSDMHQQNINNVPVRWTVHRKDGSLVHVQAVSGKTTWEGRPALELVVRDVTEERRAEENLRLMSERLKLAIEGTGEGIWDWDLVHNRHTFSAELKKILGYAEHEHPDSRLDWKILTHPEDVQRVSNAIDACLRDETPVYQCEYRLRAWNGRWKWVLSRGVVVSRNEYGEPLLMTGMILDITERKESDELIWRHANLDALTGLPNRRYFREQLDGEVRKAARTGSKNALLFLDLDGFKQVNDLYGHDAGDLLLVEAGHRIQHCVRGTDIVARLGGDEFTVLITGLDTESHIEPVCRKILDSMAQPFRIGNDFAFVSASVGIALSPMDARSSEELLRMADKAMYAAKAGGKNQFSYFTRDMDERARTRLRLCNELRQALKLNQLFLCYQPVIDLKAGQIVKAEALLRWCHPRLGIVDPAVFIPLAEESGLMGQIGNWVFEEVASRSKHWSDRVGMPFQISINKSPVQFMSPDPGSEWLSYLNKLGLPGNNIIIEITEEQLLQGTSKLTDTLEAYHHAGMQVAIDDFGTGLSSMTNLQKLHVDYLKIDPSFVHDVTTNPGHRTIAETIIVMAHKLGFQVIAEGVETREQMEFLVDAGCDFGQGYFFSQPIPGDQLEGLLTRPQLH
jgi:diguanylate cyclase (GGDEF)-like protein/PAS domain S-box-containing protein